ncbi:MAG: type VI secretion system contractile sheath large subunit [Polyangia bacterium]
MEAQITQSTSQRSNTLTELQQKNLDAVIQATTVNDENEQAVARGEIDLLIAKVMEGQIKLEGRVERALRKYIEELDKAISAQVSAVLHHEKFQKLEASWRGLHYLIRNTQTIKDIKLRVLNVTRDELNEDLASAKAFDKSRFHKKLVEDVYEMAGGNPYSAVIGDFEFDNSNADIDLLTNVSKVAALAHAPFLAAASARMFELNDFTELPDKHIDLGVQFSKEKYINWNNFRDTEESRYVGLVAPHFLAREPYNPSNCKVSFNFHEDVSGRDHSKYLWANAAYAFGARLTDAFFNYGWTTAIIGEESGGRVDNLPLHYFDTDVGTQSIKCPTETKISDPRWAEMADQGFIPLVYKENTNFATFYTAPSCQRPAVYDRASANANARLSASLPYIFAASRFAHYLKVINRTKLGTFSTRKNLEDFLNRWILNYVVGNEDASQELKATYPLQEARVDVESVDGKPGWYRAVAYLKPHMHLEAVTTSLRLVADLPQKKQ